MYGSIGWHGTSNQCLPARNCPLVTKGTYTSSILLRSDRPCSAPTAAQHFDFLFSKTQKPSLAMIKQRSADRGICLKVGSSIRSTLGACVEPTSSFSTSMMLVASIWAASIESIEQRCNPDVAWRCSASDFRWIWRLSWCDDPDQHIVHSGWRILIPHEDKVDVTTPTNILGGVEIWSLMET